jgi:hypothetical protein
MMGEEEKTFFEVAVLSIFLYFIEYLQNINTTKLY